MSTSYRYNSHLESKLSAVVVIHLRKGHVQVRHPLLLEASLPALPMPPAPDTLLLEDEEARAEAAAAAAEQWAARAARAKAGPAPLPRPVDLTIPPGIRVVAVTGVWALHNASAFLAHET